MNFSLLAISRTEVALDDSSTDCGQQARNFDISNSDFGRSGQCMAEPPSVCARRSEAVPEALGRLGMRAGGSGPHRSGQAALAGTVLDLV